MSRIEEEQKLERIHQAQHQTYLEKLSAETSCQNEGEMRGKKIKQLTATTSLHSLFNRSLHI